jgi:hypothetical protein
MSFALPTFNLTCEVWTPPWVGRVHRLTAVPCNLAMGRRVQQAIQDAYDAPYGSAKPSLLLPMGTDIRDQYNAPDGDLIEVPSGTGRWYSVGIVDDVGKGFANEYRLASIRKVSGLVFPGNFPGMSWPVPMP